jgi:DNA-binding XRE family transcriptional regulator
MRHVKRMPRVLRVKKVKGLVVYAVFNNGETRLIDFEKVFDQVGIDKKSPAAKLRNPVAFKKFSIENNTLSWKNVQQEIPWGKSIRKMPFEIGADVLYQFSQPTIQSNALPIGQLIKKERLAAGLTQGALAKRSGTTPGYISRIENNKSGIEIHTLQKLVENGLRKKLEVIFS